jgi:hypothetical protein
MLVGGEGARTWSKDRYCAVGCCQPKSDFCCRHKDGSGLKRSSTCSVPGCRPVTIASTMTGESNALLFQAAIGQLPNSIGQPALQEAPVVRRGLRVEQCAPPCLLGRVRARPLRRPTGREPYPSWRNLGRAGWHITALVGREVKRTFSELTGKGAGLTALKPH